MDIKPGECHEKIAAACPATQICTMLRLHVLFSHAALKLDLVSKPQTVLLERELQFVGRRILAVRSALLGPGATPLPVIGPRPLRRVLAAVSQLEPMAFRYIDTFNTLPLPPDQAPDEVLFCSHACKRPLGPYQGPVWGVGES